MTICDGRNKLRVAAHDGLVCAVGVLLAACSTATKADSGVGGHPVATTGSGGTQAAVSNRGGNGGSGKGGAPGSGGTVSSSGGTKTDAGGTSAGATGTTSGGTSGGVTGGATGGSSGGANSGGSAGTSGKDAADDTSLVGDAAVEVRAVDVGSFPGKNNPVLPGYTADPQVILLDGTFYIYPTTDGFNDWSSTSFSVFSSPNLVQWTSGGVILDVAKDLTWATGHAWAPSIAHVGSTYYFYFSADSQIGVATGSSPTGRFKDALGKPLVTANQYGGQSIDPYVFIDDDGTAYLYFGSGGGLRVGKLKPDMVSFSGTPANVSLTGASGTLEGSAMFKRKGSYYLAWSEGDTRLATYKMAYARAQSALGPFARASVIVEQDTTRGVLGPGGGTVLALPSRDEYYLAYHRFKIPGGDGTHRETCIDRLSFNADGTIVPLKPTLEGLQEGVQP
jgi:hypothetical protein